MSKMNLKRNTIRGAAYAGIAASIYMLSAGGALAWSWPPVQASPGQYAYCSADGISNEVTNCSGWTYGGNDGSLFSLIAKTESGSGATRARASNSRSVIDGAGGDSSYILETGSITWHSCECQGETILH